jgi:proline dehydrogenase
MRTAIIKTLNWAAKHAAASYIAGPEVGDALRVCRKVAGLGWRSTICPWDGPHDAPGYVASTYKEALMSMTGDDLDCYLSIKVPSLGYDIKLLTDLMEVARERNVRVHFDSLAPDTAVPSMALLERALKIYRNLSYTLPSGWRRSIEDAEKVIDLGVPVRLVKGQWPDPAGPVADPGACFLELVDALAGRASLVAIATHDVKLAEESLARLRAAGTACELEQLYGLPMRGDRVAKPLGVPVRVYVPYGYAYLAYAVSAMRKRPVILAWLLRDFVAGVKKKARRAARPGKRGIHG